MQPLCFVSDGEVGWWNIILFWISRLASVLQALSVMNNLEVTPSLRYVSSGRLSSSEVPWTLKNRSYNIALNPWSTLFQLQVKRWTWQRSKASTGVVFKFKLIQRLKSNLPGYRFHTVIEICRTRPEWKSNLTAFSSVKVGCSLYQFKKLSWAKQRSRRWCKMTCQNGRALTIFWHWTKYRKRKAVCLIESFLLTLNTPKYVLHSCSLK